MLSIIINNMFIHLRVSITDYDFIVAFIEFVCYPFSNII